MGALPLHILKIKETKIADLPDFDVCGMLFKCLYDDLCITYALRILGERTPRTPPLNSPLANYRYILAKMLLTNIHCLKLSKRLLFVTHMED
jgi:hypothetical protein